LDKQDALSIVKDQIYILKDIQRKIVEKFEPSFTDHICGIALTIKELEIEARALGTNL